ncbi:uncharacterized protein [Glycine max]|uniref:uncharacterized protein isoform X2 n=1 Tax=Glycine max TaxID=3847 RepID=UPI001B357B3C|nr:uncharacterized protein LOC100798146 isoform X2 [Glycine max]
MNAASQTFILNLTPQVATCKQRVHEFIVPSLNCRHFGLSWKLRHGNTLNAFLLLMYYQISVEVSGNKTQRIFDDVFKKMVAAAQPIPGFRRVKGGKTPDIPKNILLEVLGPSKVFNEVIKKIINSTVAEYVEKECLIVSKDLRVEQSFEDLETTFEEGEKFSFDVVLELQK